MLNEGYDLSRSIRLSGIATESWHQDYSTCPKNKTFRLLLDSTGVVVDLEPIADIERIKAFRKWEEANGTSFPAFNVMPLFEATTDEAKRHINHLKKMIKSQGDTDQQMALAMIDNLPSICQHLWGESEISRINRCLGNHAESLDKIIGNVPEDVSAIKELIRRAALIDAERLQTEIKKIVLQRVIQSPDNAGRDWIDPLLVSSAKSAKRASIVLELADWSSLFKYPANHERVQQYINSRLMEKEQQASTMHPGTKKDAFGDPLAKADSQRKFPDVNLPKLGSVKLRAMSNESPCQARYGRMNSLSYPAGSRVRQAIKDSVEWACKPNRKGKTWQDISGACGFTKQGGKRNPIPAILLAYPSILPEDPPELARLFGGQEKATDEEGVKYEKCAERVMSALHLAVRDHPETEIQVFVLTKADKARTKLVVTRRYDARHMVQAAQTWARGCNNIPAINLKLGTDDRPHWVKPDVPFPVEVVKCLNTAWLQGGARPDTVHGLSVAEGIALFMETENIARGTIERSLRLAICNGGPLLLAIGHADHRREGMGKVDDRQKHASFLLSLLGLLLYKCDYVKGGYMHSAPFLVGRMMSLADTLHKEYCQHVRKGQLPSRLVGNALMPTALESPMDGLARLSERIVPYQSWANTASGDDVRLGKWALGQFGNIASELAKQTFPEQCHDVDKAQMLLGYLARSKQNISDGE